LSIVDGDGLRLRRATEDDVDFVVGLLNEDDVEPFLAASRARDRDGVAAEIRESLERPEARGVYVIEVPDGDEWARAGMMEFSLANARSRIAHLGGLAIHPDFRGRHLADEAARLLQRHLIRERGFHRIELEIYGFNERAQRHAERAGFVREGVKRKAYRRGDGWEDGVLYAVVAEDLDESR